ncbi:TPA: hypothetical protein ACPIDV_004654 [Pseudomonas aeruginosa]
MNTPDILAIIIALIYLLWPYLTKPKTWLILLLGWLAWRWLRLLFN